MIETLIYLTILLTIVCMAVIIIMCSILVKLYHIESDISILRCEMNDAQYDIAFLKDNKQKYDTE